MAGDGQDWRNALFRKKVMAQIDVAVREAGNPTSKSSSEMENHVFQKAKSREEYLALVARLILHVKDFNNQEKKKAQMAAVAGQLPLGQTPQMQPGQIMGMAPNMVGAQGLADNQREKVMQMAVAAGQLAPGQAQQMIPGQPIGMASNMVGTPGHAGLLPGAPQANPGVMQDPINALQKMARHTGPGGIPQQQQPGQPQLGAGMVGMVPPQQQLQQQKVQQMMIQQQLMQQRMAQRQIQQQQLQAQQQAAAQQHQQQQQQQQVPTLQRQDAFIVTSPQHVSQQMSQSQMAPGQVMFTSSPGQIQMNMGQQPQPGSVPSPSSGNMAASPVTILMSPSPGPGPSPVSRAIQQVGAPSPGAPLNTPAGGNPPSVPSPVSRNPNEDQAYLEKLKQLSKYIEPLRRMINKAEKDGDKKKDQLSKMKNLLEILSDSNRRLPMATLLKCEQVLEKLDLHPGGASTPSTGPTSSGMISSTPRPADQHMALCQPLYDAVAGCLGSPLLNHTLQRTFGPAMMALNGPPISVPNLPIKRKQCDETEESEISDILQGEIARLHGRFKISLDPVYHPLSNTVHLFCKLDDKNLPNVPPILITVPQNYPRCSPQCDTSIEDYEATPFLQTIKHVLATQLLKMPDKVSVTSLLNTWEMSVRKACAPVVM